MNRKRNTKSEVKPQWLSADGWESADAWASADSWSNAGGQGQAASSRTSAPYIIQIQNTCTSAIASVVIGDSYDNRTAANYGNSSAISITYVIGNVSYVAWLAQSETQPFRIGRTMIVCATNSTSGQLNQTVIVQHKDASGNLTNHVITPIIDPYQTQTDRIVDDYEYLMDGYTSLTVNSIAASTTITLYLFPISKFSALQTVAGRNGNQTFNAPHLIKVAPVAVPRPGLIQ